MNELIAAIRRNLQEATIFTAGINLEYYTVYVLIKTTIQKKPTAVSYVPPQKCKMSSCGKKEWQLSSSPNN